MLNYLLSFISFCSFKGNLPESREDKSWALHIIKWSHETKWIYRSEKMGRHTFLQTPTQLPCHSALRTDSTMSSGTSSMRTNFCTSPASPLAVQVMDSL